MEDQTINNEGEIMENQANITEKKKPIGLIIAIAIIVILLIAFAIWFFLLRDKGGSSNNTPETQNNSQTQSNSQTQNTSNNTTSPKNKYEYNYKDGVLTQIVDEDGNPKQTDCIIDGIILSGNRHYYNQESIDGNIAYLASLGYKKEDLNKDFYLPLATYEDTKQDASMAILNALSNVSNGEGAAVQILFRPAQKNWSAPAKEYIENVQKGKKTKIGGATIGELAIDIIKAPWEVPGEHEKATEVTIRFLFY